MIRPNNFPDWGETRRLKALELRDAGWSQLQIAATLGVTPGAVSQWLRRAHLGGRDALRHRRDPGRASRLTQDQIDHLMMLLTGSPQAAGLQCETLHSEAWTRGMVKDLILREFGVSYHPAHVSRLVRSYGASLRSAPIRLRR
jgi:transposase